MRLERRNMDNCSLTQRFIFATQRHRKTMEKELSQTGVHRGQHRLLMHLSRHPDASQTEIASHLKVSTATVAVAVKKLEKGGYITRVIDGNDNRFNKVMLTQRGVHVVDQSKLLIEQIENTMYDGFSEEEKECFADYLERIYKNLGKIVEE